MTSFASPISDIQNVRILPFPKGSRPLKRIKAVAMRGRYVMAVSEDGSIYCNHAPNVYYILGGAGELEDRFVLMRKLGVLSVDQVRLHLMAAKAADTRRELVWRAESVRDSLKKADLRPTKAQQAFIDKHAPKVKP